MFCIGRQIQLALVTDNLVQHPAPSRNRSITSFFNFVIHQFVSTYGVSFTAPIVFALGFRVLSLFGHNYSKREFYWVVSETPYFPVQIIFALILGGLLGRSLKDKSIIWIWVLPFVTLSYELVTVFIPVAERTSRLSYFFGDGCQVAAHCLAQLLITMPFYSSLAYSIGAFLARRMAPSGPSEGRKLSLAVMSAGLIIILSIAVDLVPSMWQTGWQRTYWLVLATPVGLGGYLLYVASTIRRHALVESRHAA
jgi:hypothetical protein